MSINTINKSKIIYIHKFLFRLFVVSTKLTYSSIKFVLMFILYWFSCDKWDIKKKSNHSHKEFEKYNHIILSFKNVDIKDVDEILYLYIKDYNKKYNQDCKYLMTDMINNTINVSLSNYLRDAIDNLYLSKCICITMCHRHFFIIVFIFKLIVMI